MTEMVPRSGASENGSTVIKLDTVRRIAEKVNINIHYNDLCNLVQYVASDTSVNIQ